MKPRTVVWMLLLAPIVLAQEADPQPAPVESVAAEVGTIRKTLDLRGTFLPSEFVELKLDLKNYRGDLKIAEIKPHGAFVNEGDVIVRLETKAIDRQIVVDSMGLERAVLDLEHAKARQRMSEENDKARLESVELDFKRAELKLKGFLEHEKAYIEEGERLSLQARKNRLDDQHDELVQLEKMYAEDELVDATEEIVLKRSRRNFARAKESFDLSEQRRLYRKEYFEAWREEDLRRDVTAKKRALEQFVVNLEMGRDKARLEMQKRVYDLGRTKERFAELEKDRKQFTVHAPRSGIVLHGAADAAPWGELKKGAGLRNRTVFATIAAPDRYRVATSVAEKDILRVRNDLAVEIAPTASEELKLAGSLSVERLPRKGGAFKASVEVSQLARTMRPGMTCGLDVILEEARNVVMVPVGCVQSEGEQKILHVSKGKEGPFVARPVTTGLSDGKNIAILQGLAEGEFVRK